MYNYTSLHIAYKAHPTAYYISTGLARHYPYTGPLMYIHTSISLVLLTPLSMAVGQGNLDKWDGVYLITLF